MADRRTFLQGMSSLPVLGSLFAGSASAAKAPVRDHFQELGITPFINAAGTYTALTASLMPAEVMAAMQYASKQFVHLTKLQDAVGAKIAAMIEYSLAGQSQPETQPVLLARRDERLEQARCDGL